MTCAENREQHSALLDGELTVEARARVQAHLDGCGECAGELARLARMLGMLHALPPERAPVGFVDRVLEAARPTPWYVRLGRRVLLPWRVKVPLEAAAVIVVALGAVYVFQRMPELQQAARYEAPAPAPAPPSPSAPAPSPAPPAAGREPVAREPAPAPESRPAAPPAESQEQPARSAAPPAEAPRADSSRTPKLESVMKERDATLAEPGARAAAKTNVLKDAPRPAAPAPAATAETERAREKKADDLSAAGPKAQVEGPSQPLGQAAPAAPATAHTLTAPHVSGRLRVFNRDAAERALADLRDRLGVAEAFRRDAGDGGVVIEVVVPRAVYAEFTRGLTEIGVWAGGRDPATPPEQIRLQILLLR